MSFAGLKRLTRRWTWVIGSAVLAVSSGCGIEAGATYPGDGYEDYPPDWYIATTEPVYFEGRPAYWYHDHWNYRDGGRWRHFDREPPALYQRRMQGPPVRHTFEPPRGRPAPAAGHVGGRVGGRR